MVSQNKQEKDRNNEGFYQGINISEEQKQKAKENLAYAKKTDQERIKSGNYKYIKTFKGYILTKIN